MSQSKELEEIKHKEETERLSGELASLEAEVQRLQEEVLLLRFNSQNSSYRDSVQEFKNTLFETSKKKFYGEWTMFIIVFKLFMSIYLLINYYFHDEVQYLINCF